MNLLKALLNLIHEINSDNYFIYYKDNKLAPIISFYQGFYSYSVDSQTKRNIYKLTEREIIEYYVEQDKVFSDQINLLIYLKDNVKEI